MDVRLTRTGNRVVGLAIMMLVSAVIGTVVVAAGKSPAKPPTVSQPAAAAPAAAARVKTTPLPTKYVVLTFDDGPDVEYPPKGLDILARFDAKATFFEVGQN